MNGRYKLLSAVLVLIAVGAGLAYYKTRELGVPFWKGERVEEWLIEARVSFAPNRNPIKVRLALPAVAIEEKAGQESGSLGYHYNIEPNKGEYVALWSSGGRETPQALYYRVRIPVDIEGGGGQTLPALGKAPEPVLPGLPGAVAQAAETIVGRARAVSEDPDALFVSLFGQIFQEGLSQEFVLLKRHYEPEHGPLASLMTGIDLLAMAGVPARIAYGVRLDEENRGQAPLPLVEYYDGAGWKVRDPLMPAAVLDDRNVFVWHRGGGPLLDISGGENSRVSFTVVRDRIPLERLSDLRDSPVLVSTILGLPATERAVFRYIVLIPLGAFVVVVLRNVVGISTLGTFMPVLLALALLEIPLERGLIMFSVLIAAGLWFRFLLSRLNLLVVPRVAACVVIVTILMMLMSVLGYRLGVGLSMQITLFPMIILAWTIERMSLIWEEEGKRSALVQVAGSLVVAVCAFQFMRVEQIQYWAFYFPELLLVLLAGILLIGRYTGYRLSELVRFRNFSAS
jgi:hypothetical protein